MVCGWPVFGSALVRIRDRILTQFTCSSCATDVAAIKVKIFKILILRFYKFPNFTLMKCQSLAFFYIKL